MNRTSNGKSYPSLLDFGNDAGGISHRSGETIRLRDHEGVAVAHRCESLT